MPRAGAIRLTIVIVTFHSRDVLAVTLPALAAQMGDHDELVVVDNAPGDGTAELARELVPRARIVEMPGNAGFAAGANAGARVATGDLLLFLNPDAAPAPGFLEAIRAPLRDERGWSGWMGLVTTEGGRLVNTSGGRIHFTGIAWAGDAGRPVACAPSEPREVPFLSGACLAVPRTEWERVGGFAGRFFMYHEDVDLSLRLRLRGGRLGLEPRAQVVHDYEFAKGAAKWRMLERNRWATVLRCYPGSLLVLLTPALLATEVALLGVAAAGGWLPEKLRASGEVALALPRLLAERRAIQATRKISAHAFAAWLSPDLDSPFLGHAGRSSLLRAVLRAYWRPVLSGLRAGRSPRR